MHLLCVGISHHTAPVALRERLTLDEDRARAVLKQLHTAHQQSEGAVVSTCNRLEVYLARPLHGHPRVEQVIALIATQCDCQTSDLVDAVYHHDNEAAVRHLFRVTCGLDSMVLGEHQIVTQIKQAYDLAQQSDTCGKVLHRLFQDALAASKQVRSETGIGAGRLSVASAAVDFASHLFASLHDKTVLSIGAGKMSRLAVQHFMEQQPAKLLVCNRSREAAHQLASAFGGEACGFDTLEQQLVDADVVITCTGANEPIATLSMMRRVVSTRSFRPLFIIDIAVPRDFEPAVSELPNVYLYNLDDLQRVVAGNQIQRTGEVDAAEAIVEQAVSVCYTQVQTGDFGDLVKQLRAQMDAMCRAEAERAAQRLQHGNGHDPQRIVDELTDRLVNKILHRPLNELGKGTPQQAALYAAALRRVFALEMGSGKSEGGSADE